jgi:radical SAM protein with 4Fe4S-binding SPASM domain
MTLALVDRVISELAGSGVMQVVFTGGEPLLHSRFLDVYGRFKRAGFLTTLMTNGYLLGKAHFDVFRELPPKSVEISIYGMDERTFRAYTGVAGDPGKVIRNVEVLVGMGVDVQLKSVLTTVNFHEREAYRRLAERLGVGFRYDTALYPRLDRSRRPLRYQLSLQDVIAADSPPVLEEIRRRAKGERVAANRGRLRFRCGMGRNLFVVDPEGFVEPCVILRKRRWNIGKTSLRRILGRHFKRLLASRRRYAIPCDTCGHLSLCACCEAIFMLENEDPGAIRRHCAMTLGRIKHAKEAFHEV